MRTVLAINSGSSSLKVSLLKVKEQRNENARGGPGAASEHQTILKASAEQLNQEHASIHVTYDGTILTDGTSEKHDEEYHHEEKKNDETTADDQQRQQSSSSSCWKTEEKQQPNMSHSDALEFVLEVLRRLFVANGESVIDTIVASGHRVVHGGTYFHQSVIVGNKELEQIKELKTLAPLHNPSNAHGIEIVQKALPHVPCIAVFDTSFHTTIPNYASTYPIPKEYRDNLQVKRYGFHGTSVKYVAARAAEILTADATKEVKDENDQSKNKWKKTDSWNLIVAHLGNGASLTAVKDGTSMDTTMGFTPLEGLMMGTRCGSIDPGIVPYLCEHRNQTPDEILKVLNKQSGLLGVAGVSDMRDVLEKASDKSNKDATLAVEMFCYILAKHIASMCVAFEGEMIDALVFTAGIGENNPTIREMVMTRLKGIIHAAKLDVDKNNNNVKGIISQKESHPKILVVETNEEAMICQDCLDLIH